MITKFKVWDKKNNDWFDEDLMFIKQNGRLCFWNMFKKKIEYFADKDYIAVFFTGLKDKNGEEIYIGNILDWNNKCTILIKEKSELGFYYEVLSQKDKNIISFDIRFYRVEECSEIIGNKFENKELLKVTDEVNGETEAKNA